MASGGNPNEPRSVSSILNRQRQQSRLGAGRGSRGAARGGFKGATNPPNVSDNLNPILPPLYPPAHNAAKLKPEVARTVQVYNKLAHYFRSNYSVPHATKQESGFYLDRYTDQYQSVLALKPHLLHKLPDSRFPEDLSRKQVSKVTVTRRVKRKIEDLPDTDDAEREGTTEKAAAKGGDDDEEKDEEKEERNVDDMDDVEEDLDEEMDVDTDYFKSYFDNGEGDDDDRDDEDGATY